MDNRKLFEGLEHMDLEDQVHPRVTVDEYAAKMGPDYDIVTLTFSVKSSMAAEDLVNWFERGYDYVLDASQGEGEIEPGVYFVFVELQRRSKVPCRIIDLLTDLKSLTGYKLSDWKIDVQGDEFSAEEEILHDAVICNPNVYKEQMESVTELSDEVGDISPPSEELNEFKNLAGINAVVKPTPRRDELLSKLQQAAGLI